MPLEPGGTAISATVDGVREQIKDGSFDADVSAGLYWMALESLTLRRSADGEEFVIPRHLIPDVTITSLNVREGKTNVPLGRGPVFRVTATKRDGQPVKEITLFMPRALDFTLTLKMDENGQILFFDNPTGYFFFMQDPYRLLIEPI